MIRPSDSVYPKCPTLTWMLANRVCNEYEDADCFIAFTGRKGSSKSTSSMALAEGLADDISRIRGRGEKAEDFFNIEHVRSVTSTGAIELLSSDDFNKENQIWLLDDIGTQMGSRNFQKQINKSINEILQTCRVYRSIIIANYISARHVDVQARGMLDFRCEMEFKNTLAGEAVFKCFFLEQGEDREYKKYLRWKGKRITSWVIGKPSTKILEAYGKMRLANTETHRKEAREKLIEEMEEGKPRDPVERKEQNLQIMIDKFGDKMKELVDDDPEISANKIGTKLNLSHVQVCRIAERMGIQLIKRR